jgi:hypothetical protein
MGQKIISRSRYVDEKKLSKFSRSTYHLANYIIKYKIDENVTQLLRDLHGCKDIKEINAAIMMICFHSPNVFKDDGILFRLSMDDKEAIKLYTSVLTTYSQRDTNAEKIIKKFFETYMSYILINKNGVSYFWDDECKFI